MSRFELILIVILVLIGGVLWWLYWGKPVLYDRHIPPQEISSWHMARVEGWRLEGSFYQLEFSGIAVFGHTSAGPTVLILLGEGHMEVKPQQAQRTGCLELGPSPQVHPLSLPELQTAFSRGYLRLSPKELAWPQGTPLEDSAALHQAQELHQKKLPLYLSSGAKVRIPAAKVRVIELATDQGDLLLLDSPQQTAIYKLSC